MFNLTESYNFYEQECSNNIKRVEKLISNLVTNKDKIVSNLNKYKIEIETYYKQDFENFINLLNVDVNDKFDNIPLFQDWVIVLKSLKTKINKLERLKNRYSTTFINKEIFTFMSEYYMFNFIHPMLINNGSVYVTPNISLKIKKEKGLKGIDWVKSMKYRKELEDKGIPIQNEKENKTGKKWLIKYNSEYSIKIKVIIRNIINHDNYTMKPVISAMRNYDTRKKKLVYSENENTIDVKNNELLLSKFSYDDIFNMNLNLYKKLILLTQIQPKLLENYGK